MNYTTPELIKILEKEMRATCEGKRVLLSAAERLDNPVLAKAIALDKVSNVFAYREFRQQIHEYQRQHDVSGLVWRNCQFRGQTLAFPQLHEQLIAIAGDKEILMQFRAKIIRFWETCTVGMNFWWVVNDCRPLSPSSLALFIEETEWAELEATQGELFLGLAWGNPEQYQYSWANPQSGCHRIIAAINKPRFIRI